LELGPNRLALGSLLAAGLVQRSLEILDAVPIFVGKDIGLRKWPSLGPEVGLELLEEPEVDIDELVRRAVEGAGLARRGAARGIGRVGEERSGSRTSCRPDSYARHDSRNVQRR